MKKKACKSCKFLYTGEECPNCKSSSFVLNWKGRFFVLDPVNSDIAKKVGTKAAGEYAIKVV